MRLIEKAELTLVPLSIDNAEIRKRIQNSTTFNIQYVPCIIHIDGITGVAEQYEGEKAFDLVRHFIKEEPELIVNEPSTQVQTNITPLIDDSVPEEQETSTEVGNDMKRYLKQRVSVKEMVDSMMKEREVDVNTTEATPPPTPVKLPESKRTGAPIDIAVALAAAHGRE
jgi:hypothetical protein